MAGNAGGLTGLRELTNLSTTFAGTSICRHTQALAVASTIHAIWRAQWASVMDEKSFLSGVTIPKALVVIRRFLE
ncbi:hypothetical protein PHYBLDRAFT_147248 [Phycomyces blakesleeanus NRRL 1555(-)]|uniref:Uncharacterized protein n=1 Tax=Phycomyces blakesleeanus (strain ATCC 8743b / DSM 1359 / FGSC 10004 / NBRC 33097 / NRRL 1555) TaxID=763407 RepID=A0A162U165_PHYB8|nr:hypothetical protein PHYBLDRAFT_147248 [Phycomyces blakesleeanus NRRL 1555(-)]OAD71493.1 hypothetical protein PHYBLDRAFT_147248 [Phycomyces blakesleeanus NRRL 1555(-)]|eukprot:XP_018289533.1 hypothetical protein PHYBLDRAFT_147248 [Phycomyces blakesleeanus NRRL 1555(-)]